MTDIERQMRHFNEHAPRCRPHGEKPAIGFDGIWFIECPKGCQMHDAEHGSPNPLMQRWDDRHRR